MFDHHIDALPDSDLLHHLSVLDVAGHHVPVEHATFMSQVMEGVTGLLPGRLGHASHDVASVVSGALAVVDGIKDGHDGLVDFHHSHFPDPFV